MKITIPGEPVAKARHRTVMRGNFPHSYDPQEKHNNAIKAYLTSKIREAFDSPDKQIALEAYSLALSESFNVEMTFYMPFPKSKPLRLANRFSWGLETMVSKPDLDNLEKGILDNASGILFPDDRLVTKIASQKLYSDNPRTEINIMPQKKVTLNETAEKILESINCVDYLQLSSLYLDFNESFDELANCTSPTDKMLLRVAQNVSKLAEKYGPYLASIKKKYPNFYKSIDENTQCKADLHINTKIGKTLC